MKVKEKKAISLIVLVITILVLSILAATVIISLSNTNIISEASDAVKKTEAQQIEEAKTLMYADGILGNVPEAIVIGDTTLTWDEESKAVLEKSVSNGVTTVDNVTIPDGFYYVGGTKDTGLVISDNSADENKGVSYTCIGNQFVWIPVEYTATGEEGVYGLDTGFTAVFKRGSAEKNSDGIYKMTGEVESYYNVPGTYGSYDKTYFSEYESDEEYLTMSKSVQVHRGFYIARFEAGDGDVTERRTGETVAHTVVSKKGYILYDHVYESDVERLAENMYNDSQTVTSTALYGVMWDAMLNFISDADHDITNAKNWGNYGWTSQATLFTGSNDAYQVKNIYDIAGNASEFTFEEANGFDDVWLAGSGNVARGMGYDVAARPDYFRDGVHCAATGCGFRVALYLKY